VHATALLVDDPEHVADDIRGRKLEVVHRLQSSPFARSIAGPKFQKWEGIEADDSSLGTWSIRVRDESTHVRHYWIARGNLVLDLNVTGMPIREDDVKSVIEFVFEGIAMLAEAE